MTLWEYFISFREYLIDNADLRERQQKCKERIKESVSLEEKINLTVDYIELHRPFTGLFFRRMFNVALAAATKEERGYRQEQTPRIQRRRRHLARGIELLLRNSYKREIINEEGLSKAVNKAVRQLKSYPSLYYQFLAETAREHHHQTIAHQTITDMMAPRERERYRDDYQKAFEHFRQEKDYGNAARIGRMLGMEEGIIEELQYKAAKKAAAEMLSPAGILLSGRNRKM